jgi:Type I restriction enzyme R protein N terminus (HSDR_N)
LFKIPKRAVDRIATNLKTFQAVAQSHKTRDVSEADTVTLVKDILSVCFGYDKYQELTSEQQIRGTFCDLAVKIDGTIKFLIEVKAAGVSLNDSHLRQAINYGANEGIEWIVLTNAVEWRLHRIKFGQPIETEEVSSFSLVDLNAKNEDDLNKMFLLCREGLGSGAMNEFHQHAQILNRFTVAQVILSDPVVASIRKELRRLFSDIKVDPEQISDILNNDVLKREVIEGDKPKEMQQKIKKISAKITRLAEKKAGQSELVAIGDSVTSGERST